MDPLDSIEHCSTCNSDVSSSSAPWCHGLWLRLTSYHSLRCCAILWPVLDGDLWVLYELSMDCIARSNSVAIISRFSWALLGQYARLNKHCLCLCIEEYPVNTIQWILLNEQNEPHPKQKKTVSCLAIVSVNRLLTSLLVAPFANHGHIKSCRATEPSVWCP